MGERMKFEKHKWIKKKKKEYIKLFGKPNHHGVIEYMECDKCGARKEI